MTTPSNKIELSPAFTLDFVNRMFGLGLSVINNANDVQAIAAVSPLLNRQMYDSDIYSSARGTNAFLHIMKGAVPDGFGNLSNYSDRSNDTLITFATDQTGAKDFLPSATISNPAVIATGYSAATASGLATWFWLTQQEVYSNQGLQDRLIHQIVGTVDNVNSEADLEISDKNVVQGQPYRVLNLRLRFPTVWSF